MTSSAKDFPAEGVPPGSNESSRAPLVRATGLVAENQASIQDAEARFAENFSRSVLALEAIANSLARLYEVLSPIPSQKVGSRYVAGKIAYKVTYVSQLVRTGHIPKSCVVPGTGKGKRLSFFRDKIDEWIGDREKGEAVMPRKPKLKPAKVSVQVNGVPVFVRLYPPVGAKKSWYAYWSGLATSKSTRQPKFKDAVAAVEAMLQHGGKQPSLTDAVLSDDEFIAILRRHFAKKTDPLNNRAQLCICRIGHLG